MEWRVRQAGPDDAAALSLVANAAFLDTYAMVLNSVDLLAHCLKNNGIETFAAWARDPGTILTLAEVEPGHAPVGYAVLTRPDLPIEPRPGDIELRRIYTLKQTHGSGVGPALMMRASEDAVRSGYRRMLLGVWEYNERARAFYGRNGFTVIGRRQFEVGAEVHDDPIYALSL